MFLTPPTVKKNLNNAVTELHHNNFDQALPNKSAYATLGRYAEGTSEEGSSGMGSQDQNTAEMREIGRIEFMNSCV
ncbi:hypothetical protein Ciccas_008793 [Cichlidogyrus casuarinus]|uniref:Uncharacterized protein n=1 Tax=Cichlidogyrus casuarinus TaxID=1844966 RepID=A0ABD2PYV7_9PLAT